MPNHKDIPTDLLLNLSPPKYSEVYSFLYPHRIIFISEEITKNTASALSALLFYYDYQNNKSDITIFINTVGGDSSALSNIYDAMHMIKSPIKTICIGKAYSAGAFILAAGTKGKRYITKNSFVMIHGLQCEFPGVFNEDQKNSQIYYDFLNSLNKNILKILAKHTGKTFKQISEDCKQDVYFDAKEAIKYGLVDHIL